MVKLKYNSVRKRFLDLGLKVFTAHDLQQVFGASKRASQAFLSYNTKKGYLKRLRQGYYSFSENVPHSFVIANEIYQPSYISLQSGMSFHNLIPETVYSVSSVSTRKTKKFSIEGKNFSYRSIKKEGFFGYQVYQLTEGEAYIAVPEKSLADYLYYQKLNGGGEEWNERLDLKNVDKNKLKEYLKRLGGKRLVAFWEERNA